MGLKNREGEGWSTKLCGNGRAGHSSCCEPSRIRTSFRYELNEKSHTPLLWSILEGGRRELQVGSSWPKSNSELSNIATMIVSLYAGWVKMIHPGYCRRSFNEKYRQLTCTQRERHRPNIYADVNFQPTSIPKGIRPFIQRKAERKNSLSYKAITYTPWGYLWP